MLCDDFMMPIISMQFTKFAGEGQWNKVAIALVNSGGIRASIDERAQNGRLNYCF
jgi:5'-nucleotidase